MVVELFFNEFLLLFNQKVGMHFKETLNELFTLINRRFGMITNRELHRFGFGAPLLIYFGLYNMTPHNIFHLLITYSIHHRISD